MTVDEALLYHRIVALAEDHFHPELTIHPDTTLQSFYTEPEPMAAFLSAFFDEYEIDASSFHFHKFFRSDYYHLAVYFDLLRTVQFPITFDHLTQVAQRRQWFDPPLA